MLKFSACFVRIAALCLSLLGAQTYAAVITNAGVGPIKKIFVGADLQLQVIDSNNLANFFGSSTGPAEAGTFLAVNGTLYRPSALSSRLAGSVAFTTVSQSTVTGNGSAGTPYSLTTVVNAGASGIVVSQTDKLVATDGFYSTDITLTNNSSTAQTVTLYRGGDCLLGGSDSGFGAVIGSGVFCAKNRLNSPPGQLIGLRPTTPGSKYFEGNWSTNWNAIKSKLPLNNTFSNPASAEDNGMSISWTVTIPANSSQTFSSNTSFSTNGLAPGVSLVKSASAANFVLGVPASYTLMLTNSGTADTTAPAVVSDTFDASLTIGTLPAGCSRAGQTVTCTVPSGLPRGQVRSFTIPVTPTSAPLSLSNTAAVVGGGDASCPGGSNCSSTVNTAVNGPKLALSKTAGSTSFIVGAPASYTLKVTNTGNQPSSSSQTIDISDTIDSRLQVSLPLPTGCSSLGQTITCSISAGAPLAVGASASFTIPVVPLLSANNAIISNTATVSGGGDLGCSGGSSAAYCTSTVSTPVKAPQIDLVKSASSAGFVVDVWASFTLNVTNSGSAATTADIVVTDSVPANLQLGTLPSACSAFGQVVRCVVASGMAAGASRSFVIPVKPLLAASGQTIQNTAVVAEGGGDTTCPAAAHCTSSVTVPVTAPQLKLVKTASAASFIVGVSASYTLQVSNVGSAASTTEASISDPLPANLTTTLGVVAPPAVPVPGACAVTAVGSQNVVCTLAAGLAPGAVTSFTIPVTPQAGANGQSLSNTATLTGGGDLSCPSASHCFSTVSTPVNAPALSLKKFASANSFIAGAASSYILQLSNVGSAALTEDAVISDVLPGNVTLNTPLPAGCSAVGQAVTCKVRVAPNGTGLAANAVTSFTIPVTISSGANQSTLVNTATVTGGGDPQCPSGPLCQSTTSTAVKAAQLSLAKSSSVSSAVVGTPFDYTLTITNTGTAGTIAEAIVTDLVPSALTVNTVPAGCSLSGQSVNCPVTAGLAAGASKSYTINVVVPTGTVVPANGMTLLNQASVSGGGDAACPVHDRCNASITTAVNAPRLQLTKTSDASSVVAPGSLNYTLSLQNIGGAATTEATLVTDILPANLSFNGALSGTLASRCSQISGPPAVLSCNVPAGDLNAASTLSVTFPVNVAFAAAPSTLVNAATASGGGDPACNGTNLCKSSVSLAVTAPQLSVVKTASAGNFTVGTSASYTLTVTNTGTAATVSPNVAVTDNVPAGLTIQSVPAGCSVTDQLVSCSIAPGLQIGSANAQSFVINVMPTAAVGGSILFNQAVISGGGDPTCPGDARCASSVKVPTTGLPVLSLEKISSSSFFVVDVPVSYVLTLRNSGSASTTANTVITDTVPPGLVVTDAGGCSQSGQTLTCTVPSGLARNTNRSFTVTVKPTVALNGTLVTNTATATGGGDSTCNGAGNCKASVSNSVNAPKVSITKSASSSAFVVGVNSTYTLEATNIGTADTTSAVTISDSVPAGLAIVSVGSGCSFSGQVVTCTITSGMRSGAVVSFSIVVKPSATGSITNTANETGGGDASCPGAAHCSSSVTNAVASPYLVLTKSASNASFVVGAPASYTLQVTNNGAAATTAESMVNDTVDSGLALGALSSGCQSVGQLVTCSVSAGLASGASKSFTIPVTPLASASGSSIINSASVSGGGDSSCPSAAHCVSSVTTPVNAPRLDISKVVGSTGLVVGVWSSYTLRVVNNGTASTTAIATVQDAVPSSLQIGSLPSACAAAGQVVTCTIASNMSAGSEKSFVIPVKPLSSAVGLTIENSASVAGGGDPSCPGANHCTSTVSAPVNAPRMELLKSASDSSFVVGVPASYTLQVKNSGTASSTEEASIADSIPTELTINSLPAACTGAGQLVTCKVAAGLAPGTLVSFVVSVTPKASATGNTLVNQATLTGGGDPSCPDAGHCKSSTSTAVNAPKLLLSKRATSASMVVGVASSYVLQLSNIGSAATTADAVISDNVPAGLTLGTIPAGCVATGLNLSCTVPAGLGVGAVVSYTIPVTPDASVTGQSLRNIANVSGGGDPSCPSSSECSSSVMTPVNAPKLKLVKSVSSSPLVVGVQSSYILQLSNTGTAATISDVTISDNLSSLLTLGSLPAGCSATGNAVSCTVATGLQPGGVVSFTIPVTPRNEARGVMLTNTAIASGGGDTSCPDGSACTSTISTAVNAPELHVTKSPASSSFVVNVPSNYTLSLTNMGSAATTADAIISDLIPAGLTIDTVPSGCVQTGQSLTCTVPSGLAVGAMVGFTIGLTPQASANGLSLRNAATVSGGGDAACPSAARCTSSVITPVNAPQLTLEKSASSSSFVIGVPASYTLSLSNTGTASTNGEIAVVDDVPSMLTVLEVPAGCQLTGQNVRCTTSAVLAPGSLLNWTIKVQPKTEASGLTVVNLATASGGGDPSCPVANHCVSSVLTPINAPKLTLKKLSNGDSLVVGVQSSYTLQLTNSGTAATTADVTISDTIPADLSVDVLPQGCNLTTGMVVCTVSAGLPAGGVKAFSIAVTAQQAANGKTLLNTATAVGGGDPSCPSDVNCVSEVSLAVNAPQLTVRKTSSSSSFSTGTAASYSITVTNSGTAQTTAPGLMVDIVPTYLTIGSVQSSLSSSVCVVSGQMISCPIPQGLPAGEQIVYTINVTPEERAGGLVLQNTATVSGGGDPSCPAAKDRCVSSVQVVVNAPKLHLVKLAGTDSFVAGAANTYVFELTNNGSQATTASAVISDIVPAGVVVTRVPTPACTQSGQSVTCTVPAGLAVGASASFTIDILPSAAQGNASVTNMATVSGGGDPSCPASPLCRSAVTNSLNSAQLRLSKTASLENVQIGASLRYTLTVTNSGTAPTTSSAQVIDNVPAGLVIASAPSACGIVGQTVSCVVQPGLGIGLTRSFDIMVTPGLSVAGKTLLNRAEVSGGGDASCPSDARCSASVDVNVLPASAGVQLSVSLTPSADVFEVGSNVSYALAVKNTGTASTSMATTVVMDIPPGMTVTATPIGCSLVGLTMSCIVSGNLAAGSAASWVINVKPTQASLGYQSNAARISNSNDAACPVNVRCNASTTIQVIMKITPPGANVEPVPVDSKWMLITLMLLMFIFGAQQLRLRRHMH